MGQRVLVVDDEKLIVKGIRFSLEQDNMEVDCAYDGEEALEKLRANEYDMVLLDIMLPKLTGLEVCQQLREFSNVPVIMLTAKGDDMDKIMGLEYGAEDVYKRQGAEGYGYCKQTAEAAAKALNVPESSVLVASTGVIGMQLPMDRISAGVELLAKGKEDTEEAGLDAAKAIMTTDTKPKYVGVEIEIGGKTVTIGGMCKGSGMIHPNMCTMPVSYTHLVFYRSIC